ncbi:MAG: TonB-dependent receptor [Ignavibacteria bacterium]
MKFISKYKLYKTITNSIFISKVLFVSLFMLFGKSISAKENASVIKGKVIDKETSSILMEVNVSLVNIASGEKFHTRSEISGEYSFSKIKGGSYNLKASHIGYSDYEEVVTIKSNEVLEKNIYLEQADIEIDKINVTSSKTEVTLQQTPSSISVVGSEEIFNKNILTFDKVLEEVQGVTINRSSGINVNSLSIRASSDVAGGGIGNRVLLLLDGRPSLTGDSKGALWSLIPVSIIERTEVVKGAFSSLYGSSAIGGVVNVITKKPTYKSYTAVNMNYGFYEKLPDSLSFSNKLQTLSGANIIHSNTIKKFSYLANLNYNYNDGYSQQSGYDFYSLTGKVTYDLFSNRDLEATIQYTSSESDFPRYWKKDAGQTAEPYKVADHYIGDYINKKSQSYDLFYRAIPNSNSKYTTRFYYYYLNSNSYYNPNNPVSIQFADTGLGLNTFIDSYNIGNITQVDFQLGRSNYLVSGLDLQINIVKSDPEEILYGDQQMNNFGIFAQDQWKMIQDINGNDILTSTIGLRADFNQVVSGVHSFQLSPKLSFVYSPVSSNLVFSNSSFRILGGRAFRAPSIAELYFKKELFGGFDFLYNPNLKPEEMLSFEVGMRKQYLNRFNIDMAFFYNYYTNLIQYVNVGGSLYGPFQVQNVANTQVKGFEFYIDYNSDFKLFNSPVDYYFNIGYTYLQARDLSENRENDFLPYKPENNFNFTANMNYYDFNLNVNGRYLSEIEEVLFYDYEEPDSYFLLNLKLSKQITSKLSFFISVDNLFNETYQELERIQAPNRNYNSGLFFEF